MGIKSKFYTDRVKRGKHHTHNIKQDLGGRKIVLVDVSAWFHTFLASVQVSREYHTSPPIPMNSFLLKFKEKHTGLVALGVDPYYVFDGTRSPLKAAEDSSRCSRVKEALKRLADLYQKNDPDDYDNVEEWQIKTTMIRNDMIALVVEYLRQNELRYIQAPFEADSQLVYLLENGFGDCILTEDGDVFAFGAKKWITHLNVANGRCQIFVSEELLKLPQFGSGSWNNDIGALPLFSGCDFIPKLYHLNVDIAMQEYVTADDKSAYLRSLEQTQRWPPSVEPDRSIGGASGFAEKAEQVLAYFKYGAPVWRLSQIDPACEIDTRNHSTFDVELGPLRRPDNFVGGNAWGRDIGFRKAPNSLLPVQTDQYGAYASLRVWGRDGKELKCLPFPMYTNAEDGTTFAVPHGSVLNLNEIPLNFQSALALRLFLNSRLPRAPRAETERPRLLQIVRNLLSLRSPPPPMKLSDDNESHTHRGWQSLREILLPPRDCNGFVWQNTEAALNELRKVKQIDDSYIDAVFGVGRNGVRNRALARLKGGHYHPASLQLSMASMRQTGKAVILFRILCTPSRKSDDYLVHLCFDEHGNFLPTPISRCECPAGQYFDSHMLGFLLVVYLIQSHGDWSTVDKLKEALPVPIKTLRNVPVPWPLVFGEDEVNRKAKHAAKIVVGTKRKSESSTAAEYNETAADEDTELRALFDDDDKATSSIPVCIHANAIVAKSQARAKLQNSKKDYQYKLCLDMIQEANKRRLDDVGGPNELMDSKLEQIDLLLVAEEAVEKGDIPRALITHYTHNMKHALKRWQIQLRTCKELHRQPENWPAMRLSKAPRGTSILGDKGFIALDLFYQNVNPQMNPTKLGDRDQFSTADMIRDVPIKKRRWGSEANFRRISEVACIQDRVPRCHFPQLDNAVDFAHGRQNAIGLPFIYPNDSYFQNDQHVSDGSESEEEDGSIYID